MGKRVAKKAEQPVTIPPVSGGGSNLFYLKCPHLLHKSDPDDLGWTPELIELSDPVPGGPVIMLALCLRCQKLVRQAVLDSYIKELFKTMASQTSQTYPYTTAGITTTINTPAITWQSNPPTNSSSNSGSYKLNTMLGAEVTTNDIMKSFNEVVAKFKK